MKKDNYNVNDYRVLPIEMTPTYVIERELAARSILDDDNDPYDKALAEELANRVKDIKNKTSEELIEEYEDRSNDADCDEYFDAVFEELERRSKTESYVKNMLDIITSSDFETLLPSLDLSLICRGVNSFPLMAKDELVFQLSPVLNSQYVGYPHGYLSPMLQGNGILFNRIEKLPDDYERIDDIDELVEKIIDLYITFDSQVSLIPFNYDEICEELRSYSLDYLNVQYYQLNRLINEFVNDKSLTLR